MNSLKLCFKVGINFFECIELTIRSLNSHICVSVSTVSRPGSLLLLETVPSCKDGKINIYSRCSDAHNTLLSRPTSGSRCNLQWPAAWPHRVHRQQWALHCGQHNALFTYSSEHLKYSSGLGWAEADLSKSPACGQISSLEQMMMSKQWGDSRADTGQTSGSRVVDRNS